MIRLKASAHISGRWESLESGLICLKRVKKRDIAVEELSVLLNVPSAWVTPAKVGCVGVGTAISNEPSAPFAPSYPLSCWGLPIISMLVKEQIMEETATAMKQNRDWIPISRNFAEARFETQE